MTDIRAGLLGKLPTGDGNGLQAIAAKAATDPKRIIVCVALLDCVKLEENFDNDQHTARMRVRRIEAVTQPDDAGALQRILMREFERRTGMTVLPLELEEQVNAAFADLDPASFAEERAEREQAEGPTEHEGATEDFADELRDMKQDLGVAPLRCKVCDKEIHFDPAADGYLDEEGWPGGPEGDDGHQHEPAEPGQGGVS